MKSMLKTAGLALALAGSAAGPAVALSLNGAGSTFIYPLMSKWSYEYNEKNGIQINYQSIGSGGGIQQLIAKTVDFGASDAPMTPELMQKAGGTVYHLPATMGAVVIAYNIPGLDSGLKLNSSVLASIFLGEITNWNDPAIKELNDDKTLPDLAITVAHRSDGSGTTNIFTDYLTKVNTKWAGTVGKGTAVKWPAGIGGKGNEAVAGLVKQIPGAIGYVELAYVLQNKLSYALIRNKSGQYPEPSIDSVKAAAEGALKNMPADFRVSFTNASGADAYPICGFTWILVYPKVGDAAKGKALVDFLNWAMDDGQKMAPALYYAPLPDSLTQKVKDKIAQIKY
jgi:phosphate transport system substrate-binding protein